MKSKTVSVISEVLLILTEAKEEKWYKSVGGGRRLGHVLFNCIDELETTCCLAQQIQQMSSWINGEAK